MRKQTLHFDIQSHFRWVVILLVGTIVLLRIDLIANMALASSSEVILKRSASSPGLQVTVTPTSTLSLETTHVYSFSLATLGYDETTLVSPYDTTKYSFRLPETWMAQDGILDLELSYAYHQTSSAENPALFGDLTIKFDDQTVKVFSIDENLDHHHLQIPLPPTLVANPDRTQHNLDLTLSAGFLCEVLHRATLVIHPTSTILLNYSQQPLALDLAHYPRPFFQQTFEPDSIRFVLPAQPTSNDLANALAVAASLGDLTYNQLVISATTDLELGPVLSSTTTTLDEHLIIIGQPQDNQLLPLLDEVVELPVSLHQRQLDLVTQGPIKIALDNAFSYIFTVTNTLDQPVVLSLINTLSSSSAVEVVDCAPDCTQNTNDNTVTWDGNPLAPNETLNFSLSLSPTAVLTDVVFENTISLVEADLGLVNVDTLTSTISSDPVDNSSRVSVAGEDGYFFGYNGLAVSTGDGIIQEILSPWSKRRAILIITGLDDEAVKKASYALGSRTYLPGMKGAVALVQDVWPVSAVDETRVMGIEMTFGDLGYRDQVVQGGGSVKQIDYYFDVPYGWQLTDDAFIDLYFSHSQLIDYENSGLTVFLNRQPVASIPFSDETAGEGYMRLNLSDANVQPGRNRLTLEVDASMPGVCVDSEQVWFLSKQNSKIFLAHNESITFGLDLDFFPAPFHLDPALADLLFVLPPSLTIDEWEATLHLAAYLGNSATGSTFVPRLIFGDDYQAEDLANYHIIVIGQPSRNPLLQQVNAHLPQPFVPGSDQIAQQLDNVVFRLAPDIELGYVQLIPSPWNEARALLAVTGTTGEGVKGALATLVNRPWTLQGNLALVRDDEVSTIDTRGLTKSGVAIAVTTAIPEVITGTEEALIAEREATSTLPAPPSPTSNPLPTEQVSVAAERPAWLIPLVGTIGLIVIAIFAFAFWQSRRKA